MKNFKCTPLLLFGFIFLFSCKKNEVIVEHDFPTYFPIEIVNKQDTISLNDSIVFYSALKLFQNDEETGIQYKLSDINMKIMPVAFSIFDSAQFPYFGIGFMNVNAMNLNDIFDIKVNLGKINDDQIGIEANTDTDSIYYKFTLYPKKTGLHGIFFKMDIPKEKLFNEKWNNGILLAEDEEYTLISREIITLLMIPENLPYNNFYNNYNNFNMYYESTFFNPMNNNINDTLKLQEFFQPYYFVYVE